MRSVAVVFFALFTLVTAHQARTYDESDDYWFKWFFGSDYKNGVTATSSGSSSAQVSPTPGDSGNGDYDCPDEDANGHKCTRQSSFGGNLLCYYDYSSGGSWSEGAASGSGSAAGSVSGSGSIGGSVSGSGSVGGSASASGSAGASASGSASAGGSLSGGISAGASTTENTCTYEIKKGSCNGDANYNKCQTSAKLTSRNRRRADPATARRALKQYNPRAVKSQTQRDAHIAQNL